MKKVDQTSPASNLGNPKVDSKVWAFRLLAVLIVVLLAETVAIGILWKRGSPVAISPETENIWLPDGDFIKRAYPHVDFTTVYPGLSSTEIDAIQRECFAMIYQYEPFTGFTVVPAKKQTVHVTSAGFRTRGEEQPWPPDPEALNVFVFGGSTAFGYTVRGQDTLPAALQDELRRTSPLRRVECYNFGCGYYFSTQERLRFEQLLAHGIVPKLAVFLDGLNDFHYAHGLPQFASQAAKIFPGAPPIQMPDINTRERALAVVMAMLGRYQANTVMIDALAKQWGIGVLFVGQPIPFYDLPLSKQTYPFPLPEADHSGARFGYRQFRDLALAGKFGPSFIWCGDAFANAKTVMYADSVHYSPEGNRVLARVIVERAKERGLLKF